jgi:putative phage-type endonuclease
MDTNTKRYSIGGSLASAVCGVSPWSSPLDAYYTITNPYMMRKDSKPEFYWGHKLEPVIRERFIEETGYSVEFNQDETKLGIEIVHPVHSFITGSLDGMSFTPDGESRMLEIKTARDRRSWQDGVPEYYVVQILHYMSCLPHVKVCDVAVLFGASDFEIFEVQRDDDIIDVITRIEVKFWNENIMKGIPPEPTTINDRNIMWPKSNMKSIEASDDTIDMIRNIKLLKEEIAVKSQTVENMESMLKDMLKDNEAFTVSGKPVLTWKSTKPSTAFDKDRFMAENPDVYKQYLKEKPGYRRFIIK